MTPENFNLQIQTPETGDSDEISKLKAEMMSYKPLLDDAIKRQNLKEAEALFAKAKELKAKLDELRKTKEIKTIEIRGQKLEVGPNLGEMSWNEIPAKLEELNKTLKPGEKPWRVLTADEFKIIGMELTDQLIEDIVTSSQNPDRIRRRFEFLGLKQNAYYWSNLSEDTKTALAWNWESYQGSLVKNDISSQLTVLCVR
jgi:hypothetical protein